ncbi:MAG: cation:proton antiporter [Cyclobacteriaceae bacterium]|nr:cation:proton antiporter [Cyclobacteriaceae bacterium]MBX2956905.1 cation:proton antiporter [Cyclobacteriaceae bacterium]
MLEHPIFVFMALMILGYGIFSKLSSKSIISAPMVFVAVGVLVSFLNIELLAEGPKAGYVKVLAELTLILVLFIDASTINLKRLIIDRSLPTRLLGIGLPITMALGALIAIPLFPDQPVWLLLLMAFILSPTDAALGQAVVTGVQVPQRIRQTINVESGLNDGIALPPILVCLAVLSGEAGEGLDTTYWLGFVARQFVFGPLIGGLVGWGCGRLVEIASQKGWMNHIYQMLASLAIAILAYSLAELLHGNGFIAAYFAGLFLGVKTESIKERIQEFGEAQSQIMVLFIFLLFGMLLVPVSFPYWDWKALIYAVLSLTVIRMVPVAISLIGSGLDQKTIWFIGWFGPRGIASVLYLLMAVIMLGKEGYERIISVITLTVLLSIFLHGVTAVPYSRMFAAQK